MKRILILIHFVIMVFIAPGIADAQNLVITGTVTSAEDKLPVIGATILEKGTTNGTITNVDGKYRITVPSGSVLIFSYLGMQSVEHTVAASGALDIIMEPEVVQMDELILIGYGSKKKRDIIGSVSSINSEDIISMPAASLTHSIQGKAAGVYVASSSGVPGSQVQIRVRGENSISLNTSPLWIIDGMPVYSGGGLERTIGSTSQDPMSMINPNDIESIQILKDAAATSIYGSRGSNGVILITTKSGKQGRGFTSLNYGTGIMNLSTTPEQIGFTNTTEWFSLMDQARANSGLAPFQPFDIIKFYKDDPLAQLNREEALIINTDWFDQILQTGSYHDINLSSSGGGEIGNYYLSVNYNDTRSVLKENFFKKFTARANLDFEPVKNLMMGSRFSFAGTRNTRVQQQVGGATGNNNGGASAGFGNANRIALPWLPIFDNNHPSGYWNPMSGANLVASIDEDNHMDEVEQYRGMGTIYIEYTFPFTEGLKIRSEGSIDFIQNNSVYWVSSYLRELGSYAADRAATRKSYNYNIYGSFNREFADKHTVGATFGAEWQSINLYQRNMEAQNLTGTYQQIGNPNDYLSMSAGITEEEYLLGYIGRADYQYKNKYLLGISLRRDGSSKFREDVRWQNFVAWSAGWIISDEQFFSYVPVVNFLKLRGSFGQTGNKDIPPSRFVTTYTNDRNDRYGLSTLISGGTRIGNLGVPALTWETTNNYDIGIDYGILNNRLNGSFAYYLRDIKDLLLFSSLPPSAGVGGLWNNIGDMRNSGLEFSLNSVNIHKPDREFKWMTDFNIASNHNKVISLTPMYDRQGIGVDRGYTKSVTGGHLWAYYVCEWAGVDAEKGVDMIYEIDYELWEKTGETIKTGRLIPATQTNMTRNRIVMQDKTAIPKWYGGINNDIEFKGFSLSLMFTFSGGNYIYDYEEQRTTSAQYGQVVLRREMLGNTWENPGDKKKYPQLVWDSQYDWGWDVDADNPEWTGDPEDPRAKGYWVGGPDDPKTYVYNIETVSYSKYLYKADYIRLRHLELGYTIPVEWTRKILINGLRVYCSADNIWKWSKYKGWDPETGGGVLPPLKIFSFGANIKF
jgi:TonB-linked SusC/RagA family outer membrane protein